MVARYSSRNFWFPTPERSSSCLPSFTTRSIDVVWWEHPTNWLSIVAIVGFSSLLPPKGSSIMLLPQHPFRLWPIQKLSRCYPPFRQTLLTKIHGPSKSSIKIELKELWHFWFQWVEEKIHPILKMRCQGGDNLWLPHLHYM